MGIVPYLASFRWYAAWLDALCKGHSEEEAVAAANRHLSLSGKDLCRACIKGKQGEILLSVPVAGGRRALKELAVSGEAALSEHGNWRHVHTGALEACYGKAPFYPHLIPSLEEIYHSGEADLAGFTGRLHEAMRRWLILPGGFPREIPEIARGRGAELMEDINPDMSLLDALMRFGPETLLPLLAGQIAK